MRLNWIFLRLALLAALPLVMAGCGGINASKSVSPLDFFMPGLIRNEAPTTVPAPAPKVCAELAAN